MTIRKLAYGGLMLLAAAGLAACGSQQRDTPPAAATLAAAEPAPPAPAADLPPGVPPLPADLLAVGSQQARDELYCSALIYAENPDVSDALAPVDEAQLPSPTPMPHRSTGISRPTRRASRSTSATHAPAPFRCPNRNRP
jgi:hypothetical protein